MCEESIVSSLAKAQYPDVEALGARARMSWLVVELSSDRHRCGRLQLLDKSGAIICGPFPVAGLASSNLAAKNRNPSRNPILPYGDTPTGRFAVRAHISSGNRSPLPKGEFGPAGVLILEGVTGDAALADANGRFSFAIQGGELASSGQLRSTAGSLRMHNADLRTLIPAVTRTHASTCEIIEVEGEGGETVCDDETSVLIDPLPSALTQPHPRATAGMFPRPGTALLAMGASFAVQGSLSAAPHEAAFANRSRVPAVRAVHWMPAAVAAAAVDGQAYNPPAQPGTSGPPRTPAIAPPAETTGPPRTPATPPVSSAVDDLIKAQNTAISNPDYGPGVGGTTHCNQATCDVAKEMGAPMTPFLDAGGKDLSSTQIGKNLAKPDSGYRPVTAEEAQRLADQGKLVVVTGPGHVATVRPDNVPGQTLPPGSGPVIANVGSTNGTLRLNYVFKSDDRKKVQYYTPK